MNSRAIGLSVRFFKATIPIVRRCPGMSTGNALSERFFVITDIIRLAILISFPALALYLPNHM